jgi:hypothetical protein
LLPAIYDLAGDTWARSAANPGKEDAKMMVEGAQLFPTRLKLIFQAGVMARDTGDLRSAHALADHGIKWGPDAGVRQRFEALKSSLPPAPPPSPEASEPRPAPARK